MRENEQVYLKLLAEELTPAVGCTEPIAIALACARAAEQLEGPRSQVISIELELSANVIKNAMGVGIPGSKRVGIPIAAALGTIGGDSSLELEVLSRVNQEQRRWAEESVDAHLVTINRAQSPEKLYVRATLRTKDQCSSAVIERDHRLFTSVTYQGEILESRPLPEISSVHPREAGIDLRVESLYRFATSVDTEKLSFLLEGVRMNRSIAEEGLLEAYGLQVGRTIRESIEKHIYSDDMEKFAAMLATAAADARMAGCMLPVMTNSGSGNQGITVILPVAAAAEKLGSSEGQLIRALALSNLVAISFRHRIGRLSALCGATTAAIGAACGIAFLMGGQLPHMYGVINNMIGDLSGMICDGAKNSCSLKVATSVESAFRSALLAMHDISVSSHEGIIEDDIEKSIDNLVALSKDGMEAADRLIIDIMVAKQ